MLKGVDSYPPAGAAGQHALDRIEGLGAKIVRIPIDWEDVAPVNPPPGFNPSEPYEAAYRWTNVDRLISAVAARGLTPVIDIVRPPGWAESPANAGWTSPDPHQLALFAYAFAIRFDGFNGLPWVRYWEVWNEPNASLFLQPQRSGKTFTSVSTYRTMVNAFAEAVHRVRPDNVVIGGELFPNKVAQAKLTAIAPLEFTRRLFCLSRGAVPHRVCNTRVNVDVWSVHPYTSGGPSTLPADRDNVWIDNLGALTTLTQAAQRLKTLVSSQPAQTWVTEFSWDTNPPDPLGVPLGIQQRWVAEALYRAWHAGISTFVWFGLYDAPLGSSPFQGGLLFACADGSACDTPKPAAAAFRFPFVAYKLRGHSALVWGMTPPGSSPTVEVEWRYHGVWQRLASIHSDGSGAFEGRVHLPKAMSPANGVMRATPQGGEPSPAFSLHHPRDIPATPFGS